jgi:hypothetical protein
LLMLMTRSITVPKQGCIPPPVPAALKTPGVRNRDPRKGPKVYYRAFSIPLLSEDMVAFMDRHYPDTTGYSHNIDKCIKFYGLLPKVLPNEWFLLLAHVLVPIRGGFVWETTAIVIATNNSEEEIKKAERPALVREIQQRIGVKTEPGWYIIDR